MLVIFDVDNTLVYSDGRDSRSFAAALMEEFNAQMPSLNWHDYSHVTDHVILSEIFQQQFGRTYTEAEFDRLMDNYMRRIHATRQQEPHEFKAIPQARETIERLLSLGHHVGIATGGFRLSAEAKLAHIGVDIAPLHGAYADCKPTREDIINEVLDKTAHLDIARTVYVGDAAWDVRTTRNMSIPFVGIRRRGDLETLHEEGATHVLVDYSDFDLFMKMLDEAVPPKAAVEKVVGEEEDND